MSREKTKHTLTDSDISTARPTGRRGFMGLMAIGGAAAALTPVQAHAQGTDADNGTLTDRSGCGRGGGGVSTGQTDGDSGAINDAVGWGRGAPYC